MKPGIAVVLDLLKDVLPGNMPGSLKGLKELGFAGVEIGGYYGYANVELAAMLREAGLRTAALHRPAEDFKDGVRLERAMDEAAIFQTRHLVYPWVSPDNRSEEDYILLKEQLLAAATRMKARGFRLSYHNHDFELTDRVNGGNALEFMLDTSEEPLLHAEFDTYWLAKGGADPLAFISRYPGRAICLHLKDMTADGRQTYAELGRGTIDFPPILAWGDRNGVEWYVIEQDICPGDPWDSVRISMRYLQKLTQAE